MYKADLTCALPPDVLDATSGTSGHASGAYIVSMSAVASVSTQLTSTLAPALPSDALDATSGTSRHASGAYIVRSSAVMSMSDTNEDAAYLRLGLRRLQGLHRQPFNIRVGLRNESTTYLRLALQHSQHAQSNP